MSRIKQRLDWEARHKLRILSRELLLAQTGVMRLAVLALWHLYETGELERVLKELRRRGYSY